MIRQTRWMLSQFYMDDTYTMLVPVACSYGGAWRCPANPSTTTGWALVEVFCTPNQVAAAKLDPRIVVCPMLYDTSPVPDSVITAYTAQGATTGMSIGTLIALLAEAEPIYGQNWHPW